MSRLARTHGAMDTTAMNRSSLALAVVGITMLAALSLACSDSPTSTGMTPTYPVGGMVTGLEGSGLVLRNNGGDDLGVTANGPVVFATPLASGASYSVTVLTQPTSPGQTCVVASGRGTVTHADVTTVGIFCAPNTYTVGGTVSGLVGTGLVLRNNGGDDLAVSSNGTVTFASSLSSGAAYGVTVFQQPTSPAQSCEVTGGIGTLATANVTNVAITCVTNPNTYTVGGTVSGLVGSGLILRNNGGDDLSVTANGSFTFTTPLSTGAAYDVTVFTQPTIAQTCVVTNGNGTVAATNITTVAIVCSTGTPRLYAVGGTVSGLTGSGLILRNNGGDDLPVSANGTFAFATPLASGAAYNVTVFAQPASPAQSCAVTNGNGTVAAANITTVAIACTTGTPHLYVVGGTVSGLTGSGLILRNNGVDDLPVSANGTFSFATPLASGAAYSVTVFAHPTSPAQSCVVTNGNGTVATANITTVAIACTNGTPQLYAVGGTISGLTGSGLILRNNGGDDLAVSANGTFSFATPLASGAAYSVTVFSQPANPAQSCVVTGGSGTVPGAEMVNVACTTNGNSGTLRVTVATTGPDAPATDTVWVVWFNYALVSSNGAVSMAVPSGAQTVSLNVAHNCTVTSANYVPVIVTAGVTTDVAFSVTCVANGTLRVTVATTGPDAPATYSVYSFPLNAYIGAVPSNGTVSFALRSGQHTVSLLVARNCTVTSSNNVSVTVPAGARTDVAFSVTCLANPTINVSVSTTGTYAPANYLLWVSDPYHPRRRVSVPSNGTVSFKVSPGSSTLALSAPLDCTVIGNTQRVIVAPGATTSVTFRVNCGPPGTLRVTVSTTGSNTPLTYRVLVDPVFSVPLGYSFQYAAVISSNGTVSPMLRPGSHRVELQYVPSNCAVTGPNNVSVTVASGATTDLGFTVSCQ